MVRGIWFLESRFVSGNGIRFLAALVGGVLCMQACQPGTSPGDDSSGGAASGGTESGGTSSGGAASGGTASGGGSGGDACAGFEAEECPDSCSTYTAYPADEEATCWDVASPKAIGCHGAGIQCVGQSRQFTDEDGETWVFPSGCTPPALAGETTHFPGSPCGDGGAGGEGGGTP